MSNEEKERAAAWRARMVAAMSNLDMDPTTEKYEYGDRLGDAADALADLESVRTICAWVEHQATAMANIIERNQGREVRTMEMMLVSLGSKGINDAKGEPVSELDRMRFMAELMGRLAAIRSDAVKTGMSFAVQMLSETRAYFEQMAAANRANRGPNSEILSVLMHACMIGEMRKSVLEDEAAVDEASEAAVPLIDALLENLSRTESEVKS